MRARSFLSILFLLPTTLIAQQPEAAEFAMRWDIAEGGPQSAQEVLKALKLKAKDPDNYEIRYFDFTPPRDAPDGFTAILRQRKTKKKHELTFKYRGAGELPAVDCPISSKPDEEKEEVDISVLGEGKTKRSSSYSCTVESKDGPVEPPQKLKAQALECANQMTRYKAGDLKIEEWHLPGGETFIEVSHNGSDTQKDLKSFQEIVAKLVKKGAKPSDRSKTELGSNCP
ncbi:MAG TPA: hypothetical protein VF789_24790 [Thermoanaerobaculia bacterium]